MSAAALVIHLICGGGGSHVGTETAIARDLNNPSNGIAVSHRARSGYSDEVAVEISGETGRIRVPDGIKPQIRTGGEDGWWPLRNLEITDNEITGRISLNFMNRPRVRINRLTGRISINGRNGSFDGQCEAYDPQAVQRRF